jgi:hypothetical protein
MKNAEL